MIPTDTAFVLVRYMGRYIARSGQMPRKADLDPSLANRLIRLVGDAEGAMRAIDVWLGSSDPWYEQHGFALQTLCDIALVRLFAQGEFEPTGGVTPKIELARKLAVALFLRPDLRVVPPECS